VALFACVSWARGEKGELEMRFLDDSDDEEGRMEGTT